MKRTWTRARRAFVLTSAVAVLYAMSLPTASSAAVPKTITVAPNSPTVNSNCWPFGEGGTNLTWQPFFAFIYKNIPAFQLKPGDILAFDTGAVNDADVQLQIDLARTTANGNDVVALPFTTVVHNTQTPANPRGDTTVGNYELHFTAEAPFSFPGGGLIIRFSNSSASYAADATCGGDLVGATATDTSNFFVERGYSDPDGVDPWSNPDPADIGAFRLVLLPTSNTFSFGKVSRNKHKGTATLPVTVPGPGTLALTGKGVKTQRPAVRAVASKAVSAAGTVKLLIKAKGKTKKKLNKTGKAKVKVKITFAPSGSPAGDPNTQTKRVKLVKKLG